MEYRAAEISDVLVFATKRHEDSRGFFSEVFNPEMRRIIGADFVQDNHSWSTQAGVLRGLHFQRPPFAQGKLVRVLRGRVFDVAVDLRTSSPTYLTHVSVELSRENWRQIWVPPGFAHGFLTLEPDTEVVYKVTAPYAKEHDAGVRWDDPRLSIPWPLAAQDIVLSEKDRDLPGLADLDNPF